MSEAQQATAPGVRQSEIRPCCMCGLGVAHSNQICCTRVQVTRLVVNVPAVQRQHGLELMLGGAAPLAAVMGPDEEMLKALGPAATLFICDRCAMQMRVAELWEKTGGAA